MLLYCLKCTNNTESKNPNILKTKKRRRMLLSKRQVCDRKTLKLIKEQKDSRLLSSLGIKIPSNKIP